MSLERDDKCPIPQQMIGLYASRPNAEHPHADRPFVIFADPNESMVEGINVNTYQALQYINKRIREGFKGVLNVGGPMGIGKTTLVAELAKNYPGAMVFQHEIGKERFGEELKTQAEVDGKPTGIFARTCRSLREVYDAYFEEKPMFLFVDEANFLSDTEGELLMDEELLQEMREDAKKRGAVIGLFGINSTFTRDPWPNTPIIHENSDLRILLTARCGCPDCKDPAYWTQRLVQENGGEPRPARRTDPLVQVGGISNSYRAVCDKHYELRE